MNVEPAGEVPNQQIIKPFQLGNVFRLFFQPDGF